MINWVNTTFSAYVDQIKDLKNNYTFILKNRNNVTKTIKKLYEISEGGQRLNLIHSNITEIFGTILGPKYSTYLNLFQIFLFIFQMVVATLNIASSVFIVLGNKGALWKYLGHTSWCLSAFNFFLISIIISVIYAFGAFLIAGSLTFQELAKTENATDLYFDEKKRYLSCFIPFDIENYYNYVGEKELIDTVDSLINNIVKLNFYVTKPPFKTANFLVYLQSHMTFLADPVNAFKGKYENSTDPYKQMELELNRLIDYRKDIPYQLLNKCSNPCSFEMYIKFSDCTYPIITYTDKFQVRDQKVCLQPNFLNETSVDEIFSSYFDNCDEESLAYDEDFSSLYEMFKGYWKMTKDFYLDYKDYRDYISTKVLLEYNKI
jgi:hypothetical protein